MIHMKEKTAKMMKSLKRVLIVFLILGIVFVGINGYSLFKTSTVVPSALDSLLIRKMAGNTLGYNYGAHAMEAAMENNDIERIKYLINKHVAINAIYADEETVTTYALKEKDNQLLLFLIEKKADLSKENGKKESPAEIAYTTKNKTAMKLFLDQDVQLSEDFIKNHLIGIWSSNNSLFLALNNDGSTIDSKLVVKGNEQAADLKGLRVMDFEKVSYQDNTYSKSDIKDIVQIKEVYSDEVASTEETIVDTEDSEVTDSDATTEVAALLEERKQDEKEKLKMRVQFMEQLSGYWMSEKKTKVPFYQYLIIEPDNYQQSWEMFFTEDDETGASSPEYELAREEVRVLDNKLEYIPDSERNPLQKNEKVVITWISNNEISVNLKTTTDNFGDDVIETLTYKRLKSSDVSSTLLEQFPNAFTKNNQ